MTEIYCVCACGQDICPYCRTEIPTKYKLRFAMEDASGKCIKIPLCDEDVARLELTTLEKLILSQSTIIPKQAFIDMMLDSLFQSESSFGLFYSFVPCDYWIEEFVL